MQLLLLVNHIIEVEFPEKNVFDTIRSSAADNDIALTLHFENTLLFNSLYKKTSLLKFFFSVGSVEVNVSSVYYSW